MLFIFLLYVIGRHTVGVTLLYTIYGSLGNKDVPTQTTNIGSDMVEDE